MNGDDVNQAKKPADKPVENPVREDTCPACSGRGLIAVGVHDAQCGTCNGTGKVKVSDGVSEQAP